MEEPDPQRELMMQWLLFLSLLQTGSSAIFLSDTFGEGKKGSRRKGYVSEIYETAQEGLGMSYFLH